jgi:anti-sigma factor RsiW
MNQHRPFDPERDGPLLSGYVDGELGPAERALVEAWLDDDVRAREEVARLVRLKAFTDHLTLRDAPAEAWEAGDRGRTARRERSLGWLLLILGAAVVGGFVLVRLAAVLLAAALPIVVRLGVFLGAAGLLLLLISVLRERAGARGQDRYDDVIR